MRGGLYACAGASATASAAACAKRFDEPITNRSNVYFGFSRRSPLAWSRLLGGSLPTAPASSGAPRTLSWMRRSRPVTSCVIARIRPRNLPSIHSRVKSFGTATTNASSLSSTPVASENHVVYVVSLSAPWRRFETSAHRVSAVSSVECSKWGPWGSASGTARAEHSSGPVEVKPPDLQVFCHFWKLSTAVDGTGDKRGEST